MLNLQYIEAETTSIAEQERESGTRGNLLQASIPFDEDMKDL